LSVLENLIRENHHVRKSLSRKNFVRIVLGPGLTLPRTARPSERGVYVASPLGSLRGKAANESRNCHGGHGWERSETNRYASVPAAKPGMCFIMLEVYLKMLSGKIITPTPVLSRKIISRAPSRMRPELGPASSPSL